MKERIVRFEKGPNTKKYTAYVKNKNIKSYLFMVNFFMCIIKMFH
uniref:Uncharacterized protein n=1 Tax=viral metagenome TaxID=1070528 RepID=A0A6C0AYI5_9ZZZZ